jgi:transposase
MSFVTIKTPAQMDLLALHRVRSRLVSLRTGVINQIRGSSSSVASQSGSGPRRYAKRCLIS